MIPNDEEATVDSNEANKSSLVGSIGSKVTTPLYAPDAVRRRKGEISSRPTTDEWLRDIVTLDCVLFLNLQDVESIIYPILKWENHLSIDPVPF